jgi:hypothetical protein
LTSGKENEWRGGEEGTRCTGTSTVRRGRDDSYGNQSESRSGLQLQEPSGELSNRGTIVSPRPSAPMYYGHFDVISALKSHHHFFSYH